MEFITGRIVIIGNNEVINKPDGSFSSLFLVIKKKMNKKVRNIAFKCYGKVADKVLKMRIDDKVEIKYFVYSNPRSGTHGHKASDKWFTTLQAKDVEIVPTNSSKDNSSTLNFEENGKDTFEENA